MTHIEVRADTAAAWAAADTVLYWHELGFETNTGKSKLGDGVTGWNALPYNEADFTFDPADWNLDEVDNTSDLDKPISSAADSAFARKNSPVFTGNPTAPTPPTADSDTSIATTAFVKAQLVDTALTGEPTAPTPTAGDNDTSIATTAFVQSEKGVRTVPDADGRDALLPMFNGLIIYRTDVGRYEGRVAGVWQVLRIGDSGWSAVSLIHAGFTADGSAPPKKRTVGQNEVKTKGRINGSFSASTAELVLNAGSLPSPPEPVVKPLSGTPTGISGIRGTIGVDGSLTVLTGTVPPTGIYLDNLSGYFTD